MSAEGFALAVRLGAALARPRAGQASGAAWVSVGVDGLADPVGAARELTSCAVPGAHAVLVCEWRLIEGRELRCLVTPAGVGLVDSTPPAGGART